MRGATASDAAAVLSDADADALAALELLIGDQLVAAARRAHPVLVAAVEAGGRVETWLLIRAEATDAAG